MSQTYPSNALPKGTMIQEFRVEHVLGVGSFGIVYRARNIYFDEVVAIKEFLPSQLARRLDSSTVRPNSAENRAVYEWGIKKFVNEAKLLWELSQPTPHPSIICVSRFHEANGTAYMVMDYEQGESLSDWLRRSNTLTQAELERVLYPLLEGLERVHAKGVFHRDIKPPNILIRPDGSPVLIDFGAARWESASDDSSLVSILTPEYAAPEQSYAGGEIGPWTDVYALAATAYRAIAGNPPPPASERVLTGKYECARDMQTNGEYSSGFLDAVDSALELLPQERPPSAAAWRELLQRKSAPAAPRVHEATVVEARDDVHEQDSSLGQSITARPSSSTAETEVHPSMAATQASALQAPTQPALREPRTRPAQR
ncbi:MAG: serine/threonine-protein kinase, partial [Gammaproteobacteria bacterium]